MNIIKQSVELEFITPNALQLIEKAGRTCYKSEERIADISAKEFIKILKTKEHESVFEHAVATFRFITDRGVTHEMVRHRLASYSQESTRYCNYGKAKFGTHITVILPVWFDKELKNDKEVAPYQVWYVACIQAEQQYFRLLDLGQTPQQARAVLPNSLKTEIVMTANFREWMHFFKLRTSEKAHPQIRELALQAQKILHELYPEIFNG